MLKRLVTCMLDSTIAFAISSSLHVRLQAVHELWLSVETFQPLHNITAFEQAQCGQALDPIARSKLRILFGIDLDHCYLLLDLWSHLLRVAMQCVACSCQQK